MKYLKTLGLAALAAMAVMAFVGAGTASATELYSGATTLKAGTTIDASLTGSATLTTTEGTVLNTCKAGTIKGKITNPGSSTSTVTIGLEEFFFKECTEENITVSIGGLEVHHITGTRNGLVTSIPHPDTGAFTEVTIQTTIFGSCVFTFANGGTVGTITGTTSGNATFHINAVATRKSGLCPASAKWVATFLVTQPVPLHVTTS